MPAFRRAGHPTGSPRVSLVRRRLLVLAVLVGVLALHGGVWAAGCHAMTGGAMGAAPGVAAGSAPAVEPAAASTTGVPLPPSAPAGFQIQDGCAALLPSGGTLGATGWLLLGLVLAAAVILPARGRPGGTGRRAPPRPLWLDPVIGLGILRT